MNTTMNSNEEHTEGTVELKVEFAPMTLAEQQLVRAGKAVKKGPAKVKLASGMKVFTTRKLMVMEVTNEEGADKDCPTFRFNSVGNLKAVKAQSILPRGTEVEWVGTTVVAQVIHSKTKEAYDVTRDVVRVHGLPVWTYRNLIARTLDEAMADPVKVEAKADEAKAEEEVAAEVVIITPEEVIEEVIVEEPQTVAPKAKKSSNKRKG